MTHRPFRTTLLALWLAFVSFASDAQTSYQGLWYRGEVESGWA